MKTSPSTPPWDAPSPEPLSPAGAPSSDEPLADDAARGEVAAVEGAAATLPAPRLRGAFDATPFPELLADLNRRRATGALLLRRGPVKKIVYFRDGRPVSIKSNLLAECLGRVMVRERMITEEECQQSLRRMGDSGRRQGTVLIDMGCLGPHNLAYALRVQLETKLFEVFAWRSGEFQFNPDAEIPADPVALDRSTAALIHEGLRRTWDDARVQDALGGADGLFAHPADEPLLRLQDLGLEPEESALLEAIDGRRSVATLIALDLMPESAARRLLYAMRCARMIDLRPQPAPAPGAAFAPERPRAHAPPPLPSPRAAQPPPLERDAPARPRSARAGGSLLPELSGLFPAAPTRQERAERERLAKLASTLKRQDYFERLGLERTAGSARIEQAWLERARDFHPDAYAGSASAEVRELAAELFGLLSVAHATLRDDAERARYLVDLACGRERPARDGVGRILAAEARFKRGEELLRAGQFEPALAAFREAVQLFPEEGEFHAHLGWALFQARRGAPAVGDEAIRHLEQAIRLNPRLDTSYLFLGYVYQALQRPDRAEKQFEKALQCNPDCLEALRELRLMGRAADR